MASQDHKFVSTSQPILSNCDFLCMYTHDGISHFLNASKGNWFMPMSLHHSPFLLQSLASRRVQRVWIISEVIFSVLNRDHPYITSAHISLSDQPTHHTISWIVLKVCKNGNFLIPPTSSLCLNDTS